MRYTVQYIPLNQLKPGMNGALTRRIKELRRAARDCMQLMVVRRSRKDGGYVILSGNRHLEYLTRHTRKTAAPCLIDESKTSAKLSSWIQRVGKRKLPYDVPHVKKEKTPIVSWSIIRSFMKQEPRFAHLTRKQQLKVLRLGLRYKKTTIGTMKTLVDEMTKNRKIG